MRRWSTPLLAGALLAACAPAVAPAPAYRPAPERPIPYPVTPPRGYQLAVEAGTRTPTGAPGERYWTNRADYTIRARVDPAAKRVEGRSTIRYHNRSPEMLDVLHLELTLNHHAPGVVRNEPAEVTGGVEVRRVAVDGAEAPAGRRSGLRYVVQGTGMTIFPADEIGPGASVSLEVDWAFAIPQAGAGGRMGHSDDDLVYLAYWYPAMSVYDDVNGWQTDPFRGTGEFYSDFGRFDVTIEAPPQWVVWGTGQLQNPEEVLAPAVLARYRAGIASDTVVAVLREADFDRATTAGTGGVLAWRFVADSVRDAAFSLTRRSNWDARRTSTGAGTTEIHAFWRPAQHRWRHVADYQAHAITFLSEYTGIAYPWPHMSAVEGEGIIGGGMEYPMMTLIGGYTAAGDAALYNVTAHELAHMWVPMIVSVDERRYGWLDEGMTTYHEAQARADTFAGDRAELEDRAAYLGLARRGGEGEIMRLSDFHYDGGAYGVASYPKPSTNFVTLRGLIGDEAFTAAWRTFLERWAWKHPYPWDFFATVEEVTGRDLDWFWRTWFYETWTLDQAVASVTEERGGATIVVEDRGLAPMPARLTLTREDGSVSGLEVPVEEWLEGNRRAVVTLPPAASPLVRVEIDAENAFPDVDRDNNVWTRP
jgi:hypothetical protein